MNIRKILGSKDFKLFLIAFFLNLIVILFIYKSVFTLEFQGDGWQYAWGHHVYYKNVFSPESLKGMRSSLGGASLTFGLIENNLGLNSFIFYTISVILKFLSVLIFYFLVKKLTGFFLPSLIASLLLSSTSVGIEATHWVFNMYAYIGLIFILISMIIGIDLPARYTFKKWFVSFAFACAGIWYATMRTNGFIPLIILWSVYKFVILKSKDSRLNLVSWVLGLAGFILIDKFLLGQMETDYSQKYIIGEGIKAIQAQFLIQRYDFLFASATNLGTVLLPDITWYWLNFPSMFSLLGSSIFKSVILPSFLFFIFMGWLLTSSIEKVKKHTQRIQPRFVILCLLGFGWTGLVFLVSKLGPLNFQSWMSLVMTLFGGYTMLVCIFLFFFKNIPINLKDLFFLSFFWSFLFLLVPFFQNGGPLIGPYHRYMVTTAPSVPLFMAGLLTLSAIHKKTFFRVVLFLLIILMFFSHALSTKNFFDQKALVHSREISNRIWHQLLAIIPNKAEYRDNPPTMFFTSADNLLDQQTLFESVYFGLGFRFGVDYDWRPDHVGAIYNKGDYLNLVKDVKKNPKLLDEFYAVMVSNQNLFDITKQVRAKLTTDIAAP